jgi:uncharacterized protein YecT (DUF1311 family)
MRWLPLILVLLSFSAAPSMAASFACAKTSTAQEKAICADARLSMLDERLAAAYGAMRKQLSSEGAKKVQGDQLEWIRWLRATCPDKNDNKVAEIEACLLGKYDDRLKELQTGVLRLGGMVFFPRLKVLTIPDDEPPAPGAFDPGFGLGRFSWPEIDRPTPRQASWNAAVRAQVVRLSGADMTNPPKDFEAKLVGGIDESVTCTLAAASDKLIAVTLAKGSYGYGAAHPNEFYVSLLWSLEKQRPLEAADIFRPDSGWVEFLVARSYEQLRKSSEADALYEAGRVRKAAAEAVREPGNWSLDQLQLQIQFPEYSVAPRSSGTLSATFLWTELAPYLADGFDPTVLPALRQNQ